MARRFRIPAALPPLTGWFAQVYTVLWLLLAAVTLAGVLGGAWYQLREGEGAGYGLDTLGISIGTDGRIDRVAGDVSRDAGIGIGDRVLAIGGIAMAATGPDCRFTSRFRRTADTTRTPVPVAIQTGAAPPRTVLLTRSMARGDALYAGTGLTPVSLTWASVLLGLATGMSFSSVFWINHLAADWVWNTLPSIGTLCLLWAMQAFPNGRLVPRWTAYLMIATPIGRVVGIWLPTVGQIDLGLLVPLTLIAMVVRYRREMPDQRRQWRWAMIGFVVGGTLLFGGVYALTTYLDRHHDFDTRLWSFIVTPLALTMPLTIVVAGIVLSVLRYRLYATQAAVSRSILLGVLTLALLAIFTGSEKIIEVIGEEYSGESMGALAGCLGAAFAAVTIAPLHHRIGHWVERRFRKDLIHVRHDLPPLLTELGETSDPATLARVALDRIGYGLHATRGAIVANGQILAAQGIGVGEVDLPPSDQRHRHVGTVEVRRRDPQFAVRIALSTGDDHWLLIGPRPDASLYD